MNSWSRVGLAAIAAALAVAVVACSDGASFTLPTVWGAPTTGSTTTTTLQTTVSRGNKALERVDPCALLTAEDLNRLRLKFRKRSDLTRSRGCDFNDQQVGHGGSLIVLYPTLSVGEVDAIGFTHETRYVGSRKGTLLKRVYGDSCFITFEITTWSRVDVYSNGLTIDASCQRSIDVATIIEPRLPKGE